MAFIDVTSTDLLASRRGDALSFGASDAPIMGDLRSNFRQRTYLGGLMIAENASTFNCIIRNLSLKGAMIQTLANPGVPDIWRLIDIKNGVGFQVRTVWRETPYAGVRFLDKIDLTQDVPQSWQHVKILWASVARSTPAPVDKNSTKMRLKYSAS